MTVSNVGPILFAGVSMVTTTLGTNDPEVGTVCRSGSHDYIFVYNTGSSTVNPGYGVVCSAVSGYSVTVSSTSGLDVLIGVCRHAAIPTGSYGWVVTKGFCQIQMSATSGTVAAGDYVGLGPDGTFNRRASANTDVMLAPIVGKAMAAINSSASGTAYIKAFY